MPLLENTLLYTLENIKKDLSNGVIELAKLKLIPLVDAYQTVFEVQLLLLEVSLAERNFGKALQVLTHLRVKYKYEEKYKELVCRIVHSALIGSIEDYAELFRLTPGNLQKELLIEAAALHSSAKRLFDASRVLAFLCYFFPELTSQYGPVAADWVIRVEKESNLSVPVNTYRRFFLYGILPQIFANKVNCRDPEAKEFTVNHTNQNTIPYELLVEWMKLHQEYYIAQIEWKTMYQSMVHIFKQCEFLPEECQISSVEPDQHSNLLFPDTLLEAVNLNRYNLPSHFKSLFLTTCFAQICFEYQSLIFNPSKLQECSIPVGDSKLDKVDKKVKKAKISKSTKSKQKPKAMAIGNAVDTSASMSSPDDCMKVTAQTTITLRKAQELLSSIEGIDGGWILKQMVNDWSLPFHIVNGILLCQADIRLMEKRYSDSHNLYCMLSNRCQARWQKKNEIVDGTSVIFHPLYHSRLLYSLSITSDHMGQRKIARKYLFPIIYSGIPCEFSDLCLDIEKSSKFRLRPASVFELLSRSIQHLITLYVNDIEQNGYDHDLVGDFLVLLQFAEAQLPERLQWISGLLIQNGSFIYREFFHFVFSEAIIQQIFQVRNLNDLFISLLPVKSDDSSPNRSEVSQVEQNRTLEAHLQLALEKTPKKMLLLREFCKRTYLRDQGIPVQKWQRNIHAVMEFWN